MQPSLFWQPEQRIHHSSTEDFPQGQACHETTSHPQTSPPSVFLLLLLLCHLALFRIHLLTLPPAAL